MSRPESMAAYLIEIIGARVDATTGYRVPDEHLFRGVDGFALADLRLGPELETQRIGRHELRDDLVEDLTTAGVPLPDPREGTVVAALTASLHGVRARQDTWALCAVLEVKQRARLCRDPQAQFDATCWVGDATAVSSMADFKETCRSLFRQVAGALATAYRKALSETDEAV